jgi:hypothetical protein
LAGTGDKVERRKTSGREGMCRLRIEDVMTTYKVHYKEGPSLPAYMEESLENLRIELLKVLDNDDKGR